MFAMAVGANGGVAYAGLNRLSMHTAQEGLRDVFVTLTAGGGDFLPVEFGGWIGGFVKVV